MSTIERHLVRNANYRIEALPMFPIKLALELAALVVFVVCLSTALKAFLHLRHHEQRGYDTAEAQPHAADERKRMTRAA
jgi:hypothetical protein